MTPNERGILEQRLDTLLGIDIGEYANAGIDGTPSARFPMTMNWIVGHLLGILLGYRGKQIELEEIPDEEIPSVDVKEIVDIVGNREAAIKANLKRHAKEHSG